MFSSIQSQNLNDHFGMIFEYLDLGDKLAARNYASEILPTLPEILIPENVDHSSLGPDKVSIDFLKRFKPFWLKRHRPVFTYGDGSCLYNAVLLWLKGNQEDSTLLRLKVGSLFQALYRISKALAK